MSYTIDIFCINLESSKKHVMELLKDYPYSKNFPINIFFNEIPEYVNIIDKEFPSFYIYYNQKKILSSAHLSKLVKSIDYTRNYIMLKEFNILKRE
jgi:hypothetical protein